MRCNGLHTRLPIPLDIWALPQRIVTAMLPRELKFPVDAFPVRSLAMAYQGRPSLPGFAPQFTTTEDLAPCTSWPNAAPSTVFRNLWQVRAGSDTGPAGACGQGSGDPKSPAVFTGTAH